ncbi:MAG: VWA domain-containing protein [Acidobacteriia bacterium]|nr:VWA domain-containing protein [Terriglobia bacterium]
MKISRRSVLASCALWPAVRLLRGQQANTTFSTDVKVVNVFATVRNKQGQIVRDLTKDDFQLDEDGRPQTIKYFSQESDLPLTLGLLIDTSFSQRTVLAQERTASRRFLEQVLRPEKDLAFIIHFDSEVELLQDLTSSREKLEKSLGEVQLPAEPRLGQRNPNPNPGGRGSRGRRGGTDLYDAVMLAADELMKKQKGRKALIILSDGVDTGSKMTLEDGVESAQRADTLAYSVLFADPNAYGRMGGFGGPSRRGGGWGRGRGGMGERDGKKVLERISGETGGRFFEVSHKEPIDKVYSDIEEELRNQYNLGYTPDRKDGAGYRRIHLTGRQKGLVVQTRDGYYAT